MCGKVHNKYVKLFIEKIGPIKTHFFCENISVYNSYDVTNKLGVHKLDEHTDCMKHMSHFANKSWIKTY